MAIVLAVGSLDPHVVVRRLDRGDLAGLAGLLPDTLGEPPGLSDPLAG